MENPNLLNPQLDGGPFFWQAGPVGVFLSHGFTATSAEVRPLAQRLYEKGYTVAGPLLPGHGTRPEDLNRVRWQDWVCAGEEVLAKLFETCEQVFIGGESMGGLLALYLASQEPRAAGILLYAPAIRTTMSKIDRVKLPLLAHFVTLVEYESQDCSNGWQGYRGTPLKGAIQVLRFQRATLSRLQHIHQPVLVFQGRHDTTVAPEAGEIIFNGISSEIKEHHWMENSEHTVVLDPEREQVAELSIQFIEKFSSLIPKQRSRRRNPCGSLSSPPGLRAGVTS
jgi:carboxylesterase